MRCGMNVLGLPFFQSTWRPHELKQDLTKQFQWLQGRTIPPEQCPDVCNAQLQMVVLPGTYSMLVNQLINGKYSRYPLLAIHRYVVFSNLEQYLDGLTCDHDDGVSYQPKPWGPESGYLAFGPDLLVEVEMDLRKDGVPRSTRIVEQGTERRLSNSKRVEMNGNQAGVGCVHHPTRIPGGPVRMEFRLVL